MNRAFGQRDTLIHPQTSQQVRRWLVFDEEDHVVKRLHEALRHFV